MKAFNIKKTNIEDILRASSIQFYFFPDINTNYM